MAEDASFVLTVTNQSRRDPSRSIEVRIDGKRYVEGTFATEGQHNFYGFPLDLSPGEHTLTARAQRGVEHIETFVLPEGEIRYGVLSYWGRDWEPEGPGPFQWVFQSEPPAFG